MTESKVHNRLIGLNGGQTESDINTKVNMKSLLIAGNNEKNVTEVPKLKSPEKITHYFQSKQKSNLSTSEENVEKNEENLNPILDSNDLNQCLTPKRTGSQVNSDLFSDFNSEENIIQNQFSIFPDSPEVMVFEPNRPIGLKNLGNTCYMNSMVQSLFALKFFIEDLNTKYNEIFCSNQSNDNSMTRKLLNLYNQYNGLRNGLENCSLEELDSDLLHLKECVGQISAPFLSGSQQDAAEFFNYIIDSIVEEFDSCYGFDPKNNPISRNFSIETGGTLICQKCQNLTQLQNERYNALYLRIPENNSLLTAFEDFLKDETTGHQCSKCGANQNVLSKCFARLSKVLFLQLARYNQHGSKDSEQVMAPLTIELSVQNTEETIAPSPLATPYRSKSDI